MKHLALCGLMVYRKYPWSVMGPNKTCISVLIEYKLNTNTLTLNKIKINIQIIYNGNAGVNIININSSMFYIMGTKVESLYCQLSANYLLAL